MMVGDEKQAFTFFRSYFEAGKELSNEQRLEFYDAIIQYGVEGEVPELKGVVKAMFALVKPTLDKSQSRAAAGSKGGKSKTQASNEQTPSKPNTNENQNGSETEANQDQTASKNEANRKQTSSDISDARDRALCFRLTEEDIPPLPPKGLKDGFASKPRGNRLSPPDETRDKLFALFWEAYT